MLYIRVKNSAYIYTRGNPQYALRAKPNPNSASGLTLFLLSTSRLTTLTVNEAVNKICNY